MSADTRAAPLRALARAPVADDAWRTRVRRGLFPTVPSGIATVVLATGVAWLAWHLLDWAVFKAVFRPDYAACRALEYHAACWGFVAEKYRLILFGRYPYEEQWRPLLATAIVLGLLIASAVPRLWHRGLIIGWVVALALFFALMSGGIFGLAPMESARWGGLPLTVLLTLVAMVASIPIGIALAYGRRSGMPVVSWAATSYIELVRGMPLITVLFTATFVLPVFLPAGVKLDALARVLISMTLFQAAYFAETLRGGLQAIPRGQSEAALALGLSWWQVQRTVVLPQAFVHVIPAFVNSLLATFMDTSLVMVVSMYDLTGALRLALGDPQWRDFFIEGYAFVGAIYFGGCFALSRYSRWLEARLRREHR